MSFIITSFILNHDQARSAVAGESIALMSSAVSSGLSATTAMTQGVPIILEVGSLLGILLEAGSTDSADTTGWRFSVTD